MWGDDVVLPNFSDYGESEVPLYMNLEIGEEYEIQYRRNSVLDDYRIQALDYDLTNLFDGGEEEDDAGFIFIQTVQHTILPPVMQIMRNFVENHVTISLIISVRDYKSRTVSISQTFCTR